MNYGRYCNCNDCKRAKRQGKIAYSKQEYDEFVRPDGRPKAWCVVPIAEIAIMDPETAKDIWG